MRDARVDELDRPVAGDEAADLLERPLRRREADALERLLDEPLEPLERERQVRAALRAGDGVHLVEDHASRPSRSSSRACEVSSRKSDSGVVIRMSGGSRSIRRRSFCGVSPVRTATRSCEPQPGERPAQVPLDVVVERLQRRDVEDAQALAGRRRQPVDRREERRERLARAGRRLDQTWPPRAIAGQPSACAGVGAANARSNQSRVAGLNEASGSMSPSVPRG